MNVKPISDITKRWGSITATRASDYKAGVERSTSWEENTAAADENRKAGLAEADARDAFGKGVRKAGNQGWKAGAAGKGAQRFGPGVQAGVNAYQQGFAPYADTLSGLTLSPRGPKGSPSNYARVQQVGEALRAKKVQG